MTRQWNALLLALGLLVLPTLAQAAQCPSPNQKLDKIGDTRTSSGVITSSAAQVRLISVSGNASASVFGFYDTTSLPTASNALLKIEPTAGANTTEMIPPFGFFDPPLEFSSGITVVFSNGQSVTVFGCVDR